MKREVRLVAPLVLAGLLGPAPALLGQAGPSDGASIRTLSVAVPREAFDPLSDARTGRAFEALDRALEPLARGSPAGARVRVEVASGSGYQILDWLARGRVDAAVASHLTIHLLRRDGVELLAVRGDVDPERPLATWLEPRSAEISSPGVGDPAVRRQRFDRLVEGLLDEALRGPCDGEASGGKLVLGPHLSSPRFLVPVAEAHRRVERLLGSEVPERRRAAVRERFWQGFFERVELDVAGTETSFGAVAASSEPCPESPRSGRFGEGAAPSLCFGRAIGDLLVLRRQAAEEVFGWDLRGATGEPPVLPDRLGLLFGDGSGRAVPEPFRSMVEAEPFFGTRTFSFRVEETVDLLRAHRPRRSPGRSADAGRLALVLPGGGVKAAYQTGLVDGLYGRGLLINSGAARVAGDAADQGGPAPGPLPVDSILGTSGGALLSFFVARLGEEGPFELSEVLWKQTPSHDPSGEPVLLGASDVFGWTDLPRYASIVAIYLLFVLFLALVSVPRRGWLAPPGPPTAPRPLSRPLLLTALAGLVVGTPLVVRWATGETSLEHVPEFEGLLYAILVGLVMYADQCLVTVPKTERAHGRVPGGEDGPAWAPPWVLLAVGSVLTLGPLLLRWRWRSVVGDGGFLEQNVSSGVAYLLLGLTAAGVALASIGRDPRGGALRPAGRVTRWLLTFAGGTGATLALFWWARMPWLEFLDRTPLLFLALGMILLSFTLARLGGGEKDERKGRLGRAYDWMASVPRRTGRRVARGLVLFLACGVIFDLTRPAAGAWAEIRSAGLSGLGKLFEVASKIETPRGGLLVCLGAILLAVGVLFAVRRRPGYRLEARETFVDAVVFVVVGHVFLVYVGLLLFAALPPHRLTLFELTPDFWAGLIVLSCLASLGVLAWARPSPGERTPRPIPEGETDHLHPRGRLAGRLEDALRFLCGSHPEAHVVKRRFLRLAVLAVVALGWWNFVLAPALYGNRYARDYLVRADGRFQEEHRKATSEEKGEEGGEDRDRNAAAPSYELTARFLTPANALEAGGTRFVVAVSATEHCPQVPSTPGASWHRFRVVHDPGSSEPCGPSGESCEALCSERRRGLEAGAIPGEDGCEILCPGRSRDSGPDGDPATGGLKRLRDAVFASGSVFPVFPPRRVELEPGAFQRLVDGGYSNNVPVEGAVALGAGQALVVYSSNPVPAREEGRDLARRLYGPLIDGLPRLLGFLYERSQQIDRRSRTDLFVASLAPAPDPTWPLLTDFRQATVQRMLDRARDDFGRRIGLVESWGPPRPRESFILGEITAEDE